MNFDILNPKTISELLQELKQNQKQKFRFGAGYTDLLMELKRRPEENLTVINLAQVKDVHLTEIKKLAKGYRLGAMLTAHKIVVNETLKVNFPVLQEAAHNLASNQIRQVATLGGNLCTASPSGDLSCALIALQAQCEILAFNGKIRHVSILDFFTGPRQTVLKPNEILYSVSIPAQENKTKTIQSRFIKIGTRRSMECSVVSLAYHLQLDGNGVILKAGIGIGASAPTVQFPESACEFLIGKKFKAISERDKKEFAGLVLSYATPITDLRATAWYRKEVLFNISKAIFE